MFASKTPRDLNHDPEPWRTQYGTRYAEGGWSFGERIEFTLDPRPEFDHIQHNAPNPILRHARLDAVSVYGSQISACQAYLDHINQRNTVRAAAAGVGVYTLAHIEHARRVLTRLVNLAYVEPNLCEDCTAQHYPDKVSPNEGVTHCERCGERLPEA